MYETAQLMPRPASAQLSGELICYGRAVINLEWPLLETGQRPDLNPWGVQLFRTLRTVVPKTAAEQAAYSKIRIDGKNWTIRRPGNPGQYCSVVHLLPV
jgi:hypothetical protein